MPNNDDDDDENNAETSRSVIALLQLMLPQITVDYSAHCVYYIRLICAMPEEGRVIIRLET